MEKIKVKLANRVLTVPAEDKGKYLQQGYTIYDMNGKEIAAPATDANKVKEANAKIAELNQQLADAEKALGEKDAVIAERDKALEEANAKIAELNQQLADAEKAASKSAKSAGKTKEE